MIDLIIKHSINIDWRPKIVYVSMLGQEVGVKRDIGDNTALHLAIDKLLVMTKYGDDSETIAIVHPQPMGAAS